MQERLNIQGYKEEKNLTKMIKHSYFIDKIDLCDIDNPEKKEEPKPKEKPKLVKKDSISNVGQIFKQNLSKLF